MNNRGSLMDMNSMEKAFDAITRNVDGVASDIALILGSGWGEVAEAFTPSAALPYAEIPGMGDTGVAGHEGRLLVATHGNRRLLIFQGRRHWYEGQGWTPVALPVFIAKQAGVKALLLTNAAGGINPVLSPGDLMLITDHINAIGSNPLMGPHDSRWGDRFPDQSRLYSPSICSAFQQAAKETGIALQQGIYLATSGPCYETPAEIRTFRSMGADAVGMSTVPEAMLAGAAGMRVGAISCITNAAAGVNTSATLHHKEVLDAGRQAMPAMTALLHHVINHAEL
jgi:purine-nucleoside phosphorylase